MHQQRLLPGQLAPLLSLIGVRSVITGTDDDLARSDAPPPADAAAVLAAQPGFTRAARAYGPSSQLHAEPPRAPDQPSRRCAAMTFRAAGASCTSSRSRRRSCSTARRTGSPGLAAFGELAPGRRPSVLRRPQRRGDCATSFKRGGELVISDSNRRRAFVAGSLDQNTGPTLSADQSVSADGIMLDPFGRGPDFETVASYAGIRSVQAPSSPQRPQFPEHAPFAAVDGSASTAWVADPTLGAARRWLASRLHQPDRRPRIEFGYARRTAPVRSVEIAGRRFALTAGRNTLGSACAASAACAC